MAFRIFPEDERVTDLLVQMSRCVVTAVEQYPKDAFPTEEVYGPTPTPELRLITCGGAFDRSTGHYVDNIVAFGHLTSA